MSKYVGLMLLKYLLMLTLLLKCLHVIYAVATNAYLSIPCNCILSSCFVARS